MMNQLACASSALMAGPAICYHAASALSAQSSVFDQLNELAAILERLYGHDIVEVTVVHDPNPSGMVLAGQTVVVTLPAAEGLAEFAARHDMTTIRVPRQDLMPERRHRRAASAPLRVAA